MPFTTRCYTSSTQPFKRHRRGRHCACHHAFLPPSSPQGSSNYPWASIYQPCKTWSYRFKRTNSYRTAAVSFTRPEQLQSFLESDGLILEQAGALRVSLNPRGPCNRSQAMQPSTAFSVPRPAACSVLARIVSTKCCC